MHELYNKLILFLEKIFTKNDPIKNNDNSMKKLKNVLDDMLDDGILTKNEDDQLAVYAKVLGLEEEYDSLRVKLFYEEATPIIDGIKRKKIFTDLDQEKLIKIADKYQIKPNFNTKDLIHYRNLWKKMKTSNKLDSMENFNKIIENDNNLEKLFIDFPKLIENEYNVLEKKFGFKPSHNDVLWGILQINSLNSFMSNHYLYLNIEYQSGLLLHKEKKYSHAITKYMQGLYYLLNISTYSFDPLMYKSDEIGKAYYHAQYKFSNKIIRCYKSGKLDNDKFKNFVKKNTIEHSMFNQVTMDDLINQLLMHINLNVYNPDFVDTIDVRDFDRYVYKLRDLVEKLISENDNTRITKTLNSLYTFGCFHEYLYGNGSSQYHDWLKKLAGYRKKYFDVSKCRYTGHRIQYKSPEYYTDKFEIEYEKIFSKNVDTKYYREMKGLELLKDEDYKLFERYLKNSL